MNKIKENISLCFLKASTIVGKKLTSKASHFPFTFQISNGNVHNGLDHSNAFDNPMLYLVIETKC